MGYSKAAKEDLGECKSCERRVPLTTVSFTFSVGTFELAVCDSCADRFTDEMIHWSRLGRLVDERPQTLRRPPRDRRPTPRGTVAWSMLEIPEVVATVCSADDNDEEEFPILIRPRVSPNLPVGHERWVWSNHALERLQQRAAKGEELGLDPITAEEVLWCAAEPQSTRPSADPEQPDCLVHVRGHAHVVVNPHQNMIVTVVDRRIPSEQEEELQIA